MRRLFLLSILAIYPFFPSDSHAESRDLSVLKKNIDFLNEVLLQSTKLHHSHEDSKDLSLLKEATERRLSQVETSYPSHWQSNLYEAENTLLKALKFRREALIKSQLSISDKNTERKARFLVQRSLVLSAKALHVFRKVILKNHLNLSPRPLNSDKELSFQEIADAAYHNIQQIRKIASSPEVIGQ